MYNSKVALESFHRLYSERIKTDQQADKDCVAVILGSGFKSVISEIDELGRIETHEIEGFPTSSIEGHEGLIIRGKLRGKNVLVLSGRIHAYEGHEISSIGLFVEICASLGISRLVLTNAAGSMVSGMGPGSLMLISDHINLSFLNPIAGPIDEGGNRFPDMCEPYDDSWRAETKKACLDAGLKIYEGVYLWTTGPSYETKAEIRFFRGIGADVVGMSTVGETIKAMELGIKVLGLTLVSNYATGLSESLLSHEEVLESGNDSQAAMNEVISICVSKTNI